MGTYSYLLGGIIVGVILLTVLRSLRAKVKAQHALVAKQDLQERIRNLPPPPIKKAVKEPELKLPRRAAGEGSSKPFPTK